MDSSVLINNFRDYLKIKTVQPNPKYDEAKEFLLKMGNEYKLSSSVYELVKGKPIIIMSVVGEQPGLPSILLNSHIDVVPVFEDHWKHDPFEAVINDGKIYARGAQDMKSVGMQYLEAVGFLIKSNIKLKRTVHLSYVPDEEIGGEDGMKMFVKTDIFKNLNVGFVLDEGLPSETDIFKVYYAERSAWWIEVICPGQPGHGSMFIQNNAAEKFRKIINYFLDFRDTQEKKMIDGKLNTADVVAVNLTIVKGGIQQNVVPAELIAMFDIRIPPTIDLVAFEKMLNEFKEKSGPGITYNYIQKPTMQAVTSTSSSDPFWMAFSTSFDHLKIKKSVEIFPGATDSRFIREAGYSAIGFSPINNTKQLLHDHNEYVPVDVYLSGIEIYKEIIKNLANV